MVMFGLIGDSFHVLALQHVYQACRSAQLLNSGLFLQFVGDRPFTSRDDSYNPVNSLVAIDKRVVPGGVSDRIGEMNGDGNVRSPAVVCTNVVRSAPDYAGRVLHVLVMQRGKLSF
jgi:hypothetical protein